MNCVIAAISLLALCCTTASATDTFRVATYNVENYLDQPTESRHAVKSAAAKAKIRESIRVMNPDVIALEEVGTTNALLELRASLTAEGQDFPFWEHLQGYDTNIHIAVLSKFPIAARRPHTSDFFLLDGRRFQVKRGFTELDLRAATDFTFTLIVAHLKSRLARPEADEAAERLGEAKVLRGIIDGRFKDNPDAKLIVLGDFNDVKDSDSTREIIGSGKFKLMDTRPAERKGDNSHEGDFNRHSRSVTWTYFHETDDTYSRIDFILLSAAMARRLVRNETYIPAIPDWGIGSDHRPIVATFKAD